MPVVVLLVCAGTAILAGSFYVWRLRWKDSNLGSIILALIAIVYYGFAARIAMDLGKLPTLARWLFR